MKVERVYKVDTKHVSEYELSVGEVAKVTKCYYWLKGKREGAFRFSDRVGKETAFLAPEDAIADARSKLEHSINVCEIRLRAAEGDLKQFDATFKVGDDDGS